MAKGNGHDSIGRLTALGISHEDAAALRRISMTLHNWHELECGNSDNYKSWAIERDGDEPDSKPFMVYHTHQGNYGWSVWCRDDTRSDGTAGEMVRATRKTFSTKDSALEYLRTIATAREPELRQVFSRRSPIADRETGARKRLFKIMSRYPTLEPYVQGDPRGCALYILRPGDVPAGERADSYYSRGIAVYK